HLDQTEVTLPPFGKQNVGVTIELPRVLPKLPAQAAVVAEPVAAGGSAPTVVLRLAVMVSIDGAAGAPGRAPMATVGWVAVGVLSLVGVGGGVTGLVLRRRGSRVAPA